MADTTPLTPDAMRALIVRVRHEVQWRHSMGTPGMPLLNEVAGALEAFLPREDADLDAIEALAAWVSDTTTPANDATKAAFLIAREHVPALIAQARALTAERDQYRKGYEAWRVEGQRLH